MPCQRPPTYKYIPRRISALASGGHSDRLANELALRGQPDEDVRRARDHTRDRLVSARLEDDAAGLRTALDAGYETEALISHYASHPTTAPFVSHLLIQRFTSSNPSPRYIEAVSTAFRSGEFDGIGSGQYGDLAAAAAAILLDREARSLTLDADRHHGVMREPLLKVHHFLRSMEFEPFASREIELFNIELDIGMEAHRAPSVFNFYQTDYAPAGLVETSGKVAPEAGLAVAPFLVGFLNAMLALPGAGLSQDTRPSRPTQSEPRAATTTTLLAALVYYPHRCLHRAIPG